MTRALALEAGPFNIRVNAVLPGAFDTPRLHNVLAARSKIEHRNVEELWRESELTCVLQRILDPDELAGTVAFLMSHAGRGISGQEISVCGGAKL